MCDNYQVVYSDIIGVRGWIAPRIRAELYDHSGGDGDMLFPVATAYLSDYRKIANTGLGVLLCFILVPDQHRRKGYAKRLILELNEKFPDLLLTDAISPLGEYLVKSLEDIPGLFEH